MQIHTLKLFSPLYYRNSSCIDPFDHSGNSADRERIFLFELDEKEAFSFEPDGNKLLKSLIFSGFFDVETAQVGTTAQMEQAQAGKDILELPRDQYLFAQERELLNREQIISMAIEIQQEGLWRRLKLTDKIYLRFLFEDGSDVTQLFRPYT